MPIEDLTPGGKNKKGREGQISLCGLPVPGFFFHPFWPRNKKAIQNAAWGIYTYFLAFEYTPDSLQCNP